MTVANSTARWPLVARDVELAGFEHAWRNRHLDIVLIAGEIGVGKTRLAEELFRRVSRDGVPSARITGCSAAAAVPLAALAHLIPAGVDLSDPTEGFPGIAKALVARAGGGPWTILVDDLPLLDAASKVLLHHLVDTGTARLIATGRTGDGQVIPSLAPFDSTYRIDLRPFDDDQVELLLQRVLGPVSRRTALSFATASGGNVLFLRELVHGALRAGALVNDGEIWALVDGQIPPTPKLTELVSRRLAAAPAGGRKVLDLLALCGNLPLADAQSAADTELLIALEDAGLIAVFQDGGRTSLTLAHPLYEEVILAGLPVLRRRLLLLEQAERTEASGMIRHDDALHVATWRLSATGTADPDLLLQAAALARQAHDYRQAGSLLEALPADRRSYEAQLLLGEALMQLGDWQRADPIFADAELSGESEERRMAATPMRTANLFWMAGREEALEVNHAALRRAGNQPTRDALVLNDATMRAISGEPLQGLAILRGTVVDVEMAHDSMTWPFAAMSETMSLAMTGDHDSVALAELAYATHLKVEEQAAGGRSMGAPPSAHLNPLVVALTEAGRLVEARRASDKALADTAATQELHSWIWAAFFRARLEWLAGDAVAARHWYAEAIAQGTHHHDVQVLHQAWGGLAACAAVLGDIPAAESALAARIGLPRMGFLAGEERLGEAWLQVARGQTVEARAVLADAAASAKVTGHRTSEMLLLTDIARLGGAKQVLPRMRELAALCDGRLSAARLAFVEDLTGRDALRAAATAEELADIGALLLAAEAFATATALWRRIGDQRRATAATNRSRTCADQCVGVGTPGLMTVATSTLTNREREIVLLAAQGRSSKDIAAALTLSFRTVENHLHNAYSKLGVATRRELSAVVSGSS